MKTITISNQKGGVGKSTFAVHLAFHLADKGFKVLFYDLDGQGNSSSTLEKKRDVEYEAADLFTKSLTIQSDHSICLVRGTDKLENRMEIGRAHV